MMKVRQWEDVLPVKALSNKEGVKDMVKRAWETEAGIRTRNDYTEEAAELGIEQVEL
jgi:hypothetical protein